MTAVVPRQARDAFHNRLVALYSRNFGGVAASAAHIAQMASDNLDERRSLEQLHGLMELVGEPLAGKRLLEVGSGIGLTVAMARKLMNVEAFGIEPGDDEYEGSLHVAWDVLKSAEIDPTVIRHGIGEAIPYPDDDFDIVYSSNVLEHVGDPAKVVSEIVRVLKPGGHAQLVVPNYGSWWEGHYGIIWLPHLSATLGKLYVRLLGRDPGFIDTLQLVTRGRLENWIMPHASRIEILDWGVGIWQQRVRGLGFSEYAALGRLKRLVRVLHRLGAIPLLIRVGTALHWETPLILTFRKRQ